MPGTGVIDAQYFDGVSGRAQPVRLAVVGERLWATPQAAAGADGAPAAAASWPLAQVRWPERTRHGQRVLLLQGGGSLQVADAQAFDTWRRSTGPAEGWVVRVQQNWRATVAALALLLALGVVGYQWGVPWLARGLLAVVPGDVDQAVGQAALQSLQARWLQPSALPAARQAELRQAFDSAVRAAHSAPGAGSPPHYELHFARADDALGPNALALPGGTIVITDALVDLLKGHDDTVIGVLAHELGHVRHRHGMRALVQFALVGMATAVALGDFSTLLAGVPAVVAQMGYARDAERQADAEAAHVLRASGRPPAAMLVLFDKLAQARPERTGPPIALASHPADEERVRYFGQPAALH